MVKNLVRDLTPPVIYRLLRSVLKQDAYQPQWHQITAGTLRGRFIYVDPSRESWQRAMVDGLYDRELFESLSMHDLNGRVVFDIGAHIGFHSMYFAELVGEDGRVYAFEPNMFNLKRLQANVERNVSLGERIIVRDIAISNHMGRESFYVSDNVDSGMSSGSMLGETHAELSSREFQSMGFQSTEVDTFPLDELCRTGITDAPYMIKIDVEGAEVLVLEGARRLLTAHHPILLIEVHTIRRMLELCHLLGSLDYDIALLKEETDGRCIVKAVSKTFHKAG